MTVIFECYCPTRWGQNLFIVGNNNKMGNWNSDKAQAMNYIGDNKWEVQIQFAAKATLKIEYKYLIKQPGEPNAQWEEGNNRVLTLNFSKFEHFYIYDQWFTYENVQQSWLTSAFSNVIFKRESGGTKRFTLPRKTDKIIEFRVYAPRVGKNYALALIGNTENLGAWNEYGAIQMNDTDFPLWKLAISAENINNFDYKYVIVNTKTNRIHTWEANENRIFGGIKGKSHHHHAIINDGIFRFPDNYLKGAGLSLPVFSLRTKQSFGVGEFTDIKLLVDWAVKTGQKMIQILPINDTISTQSFLDSYPYKAISVFALHPLFLNIFKIGKPADSQLLADYLQLQGKLNNRPDLDYTLVLKHKLKYAKLMFSEVKSTFFKRKKYQEFYQQNKKWLVPYAAFAYLRDKYQTSDFSLWPKFNHFSKKELNQLIKTDKNAEEGIKYWYFIQYHLHEQLLLVSEYSRKKGVVLKGDIPIGISRYSVDAWSEPHLYHFNGQAGAPPDDFSVEGQNWGFPTYNWTEMEKDNYSWWRNRLTKMAEYFDAYRIDHILGFFRIWEIPFDAVQGLLGYFRPSMPLSVHEIQSKGAWFNYDRLCNPYIREHFLYDIFEKYTDEVKNDYLNHLDNGCYALKTEFSTQRKIYNHFVGDGGPEELGEKDSLILHGLMRLAAGVIFIPDPEQENHFHPRISLHSTFSYQELDNHQKDIINAIYIDYYYHRHDEFWKQQALNKLPALINATDMLVCGEDLGMIPATVPEVMRKFNILSLEIQRMPKDPKKMFAHPADAPYLSVCTTSTHDMSTLRGWWEEDRDKTQVFYNQQLGKGGEVPYFAEPWVCEEILVQHLHSPAMWTVFPFQDLLAMDADLRNDNTQGERINIPSNPRHYWRYRMHLYIEDLLKADGFNKKLLRLINDTGRSKEY